MDETNVYDGPVPDPFAPLNEGELLLDELHASILKFVILPSPEAADAVTLWVACTNAITAFQHAPRLAIKSPEKRCGKSRLLDVIDATCHDPLMSVNATVAAIFRSIGANDQPPTLLVDEVDTLFGSKRVAEQNEDLRALLNAGHQRGRPALRCVHPVGPRSADRDAPDSRRSVPGTCARRLGELADGSPPYRPCAGGRSSLQLRPHRPHGSVEELVALQRPLTLRNEETPSPRTQGFCRRG